MDILNENQISDLFAKAQISLRKRAHLNLHKSYDEKVQRLLIALIEGSYVEPHFHELDHQWEMFTVLSGVIEVTLYYESGKVKYQTYAGENQVTSLIQLNPGEIHSIKCISDTALLLEVKEGPFSPDKAKVFPSFNV